MKFEINNSKTKLILKESTKEEFNQLKRILTPFVLNYRFMSRFQHTNWDGKFDYFNNGQINIGLWNECYEVCKEYNYPFEIINKEKFPRQDIKKEDVQNFVNEFFDGYKTDKGDDFIPYEHQVEAAFKILKHQYGLAAVATSGGKSLIFSIVAFYILKKLNPKAKILLIVPSISLVTQFYDEILDYNLGFNKEQKNPIELNIMEIMSDKPRKVRDDKEPNIFIGTYQSLVNWGTEENNPDFFKQFELVAVDEAHSAGAVSLITILTKTFGYAKYRFGMSGTFPDKQTNELMAIESVTGPILTSVKAKTLMDKKIISNVKIKCLILQHNDNQFAEAVYSIKKHGGGKRAYELENEYIKNSEKRTNFIMKLVNKFNNNSLVLFHNTEYGTMLYEFLRNNVQNKDFYYIDGATKSEKRIYIKEQMEKTDGNPKILVASFGTLSVGISIKALKNVIFTQSFKSTQRILQSIGRILRLHKDKKDNHAVVFDLVDQFHSAYKTILYNHYKIRKKDIYDKEEYPNEEIKITI